MRFAAAFVLALAVASCSPAPQSSQSETEAAAETEAVPAADTSEPADTAAAPEPAAESELAEEQLAAIEPAAGGEAEALAEIEPGAGVPADAPMAPTTSAGLSPTAANGHAEAPAPPPPPPAPTAAPMAMPPPAANGHTAAPKPMLKSVHSGSKVLSYFQRTRTRIDTRRAFGFVLMPRVAVTDEERRTQKDFCEIILASMDFMTPGAVAAAPREVLATYWPIVASRASFEIADAFARRNCDELIAWYDHNLARSLAAKAGVAELTGPLLITWPSTGVDGQEARDPLIVDFSKANHERATKALQYWFRQLRARPDLWTNRIREGTIRAELADAVNDTAGVVLAVLSGKWDSVNVVMGTN